MIELNMKNILKYIVFFAIVFALLKYAIKPKFNDQELDTEFILFVSIIITLVFIIVDYLTNLTSELFVANNTDQQCSSICSIKENMDNVQQESFYQDQLDNSPTEKTIQTTQALPIISTATNVQETSNNNNGSDISSLISEHNDLILKIDEQKLKLQKQLNVIIAENNNNNNNSDNIRRNPHAKFNGSRTYNDVLKDETKYSVQNYHLLPQNQNTGSFEYGYSFLPPEKWYPIPPFPPVCVSEKQCPVCPTLSSSDSVNLKDWDSSRRITPPDEINIDYITDKLNSGR